MPDPRLKAFPNVPVLTCPVIACHMGPDANIYKALLVGPDGRQRAVHGCVKHIGLEVSRALSLIRLEPFE